MTSSARSQNREFYTVEGGQRRATQAETTQTLARIMDAQFRLPGGFKIGWDGILGFIPGVGDLATNALSLFIVLQAVMLGCPPSIILRMGLNLFVDNILDAIPFVGNFFDIFWKANLRNVALIDAYNSNPRRAMVRSRWTVAIGLTMVALFAVVSIVVAVFAFFAVVRGLVNLLS